MNRNTRLIFAICVAAVAGVTILQLLWIRNYYHVNGDRFEKEVNLAFEDAVKTELHVRNDTLEAAMLRFLMDTTQISISSKWSEKHKTWNYTVRNKKDSNDLHTFSHKSFNQPIPPGNDSIKRIVAGIYARTYREEDLDQHSIWFHTQNLGEYVSRLTAILNFDTSRLRPIYTRLLAERDIYDPFLFYMRDADSTMNRNRFPDSLRRTYPVITKSFPTYKLTAGANYVRALFPSSGRYIYTRMTGIVLISALLLAILALAFWYLLRIIRREKKLSEIKNDFISNISHELKTPVATVTAAVDALQSFGALEDPARTARYLDISKKELQRLTEMVNKILNLSLYERQDIDLHMESIDIDGMIRAVIANHNLHSPKNTSFQYQNDTGVTLTADKHHLHNVLNNLVDNAVKYSGDSVSIGIALSRQQDHVVISITDDGIGIARTDLPFIFDKFYRVPTGAHKVKGYGLGLSYVRLIMSAFGGWCSVDSHPGQGSVFRLGFPYLHTANPGDK